MARWLTASRGRTRGTFLCVVTRTDWFFRILGYGLSVTYPAHPDGWVMFSEREGFRPAIHLSWGQRGAKILCIKPLTPRG